MIIEVTFDVTDVYISTTVSPVYVNVSFEPPSGGGGTEWGDITGTLSDQTDLQSALDAKVPYSGATANVDLGEYELKTGQVEFDQTPTGTAGVGVMRWNDSDGTVDLGLKGGNVTLQVGQEQVARVVNKSGVNLLESAYQVVKVTDAQGQRLAVDLAQGNNDANSTDTIGIVTENIDNNQEGFITTSGIVRGINTTGSLQGETWNDGDVLYLSPTTAGAITNIKPTAPNHTVILGYVVYAHAVNGKIFVKCDNGYELGELHDVYVPSPSNNDGIFWNSTNLRYENKSVSSALGYTPANAATTLTINGVTYDLSTSRTWTISAGISGSGASGQVSYWDGTTSQAGSNNLFWDSATNRLGIGTNTPSFDFDLTKTVNGSVYGHIRNLSTGTSAFAGIYVRNDVGGAIFQVVGSNNTVVTTPNQARFRTDLAISNGFNFATGTTAPIIFSPNDTERMRIFGSTGNVGINTGATDGGQRLQVQGTTLLNGNVTFSSATGMTWDATNSRLGIGTNAPANDLTISKTVDGVVRVGVTNLSTGTNAFSGLAISNSVGAVALQLTGTGNTLVTPNQARLTTGSTITNGFTIETGTTAPITIGTSNTIGMTMFGSTRNVAIQNGGTFTDTGERLQVTGTMKVTASVSNTATFATSTGSAYNSYTPTGYSSWLIGVETQYFLGYSGRNILQFSRDRNHTIGGIDNNYIGFGHLGPTANVDIASSSTARASLRIRSGTAPTSPNDGDIWYDGTDIKMRIGGVTKTFTLT